LEICLEILQFKYIWQAQPQIIWLNHAVLENIILIKSPENITYKVFVMS